MASYLLIDAQFDRAVEIVQSLPKNGPIQTDYEEKLTMYSLFKQATVGNVQSARPGMWDMLGRAKWDAWAKHKDLDPYEAKWLYVEALLKVLRKYSDKTVAKDLVEELESYGDDPLTLATNRTLSKSPGSEASGSTASEPAPLPSLSGSTLQHASHYAHEDQEDEPSSTSDEDSGDEAQELPILASRRLSLENRPQSSVSSQQRYRTPLAGSLATSPPPSQYRVPSQQPLPGFETPSAFADPASAPPPNAPPSSFNQYRPGTSNSYRSFSRNQLHSQPSQFETAPPTAIERAVENVQVHLAALTERLETLETRSLVPSRSNLSGSPRRGSPTDRTRAPQWDIDDLGMWSLVLNPLSRGIERAKELSVFFSRNENRSPSMIIIRRLVLDVSFLVCVIAVIGAAWRKSGVRRREVKAALGILWRAIIGSKPQRPQVQQGA